MYIGTFLLDTNGKWNVMEGFEISQAIYQLDLLNFKASPNINPNKQLLSGMLPTQDLFNQVSNHNLAYNLILAMTFRRYLVNNSMQLFQTTGQANTVFQTNYFSFVVFSTNIGICENKGILSYDYSNANIENSWDILELNNSIICRNAIYTNPEPYNIRSKTAIPNTYFTENILLSLDVNTFSISMSLNLGYII